MEILILAIVVALIFGVIAAKNLANLIIKVLIIGVIVIGGLIALKNCGAFGEQSPGQKLDQIIDRFEPNDYSPL